MLTLGVMLGAGLACHVVADALRIPRMLVLLAAGTLLGPSVLDWIDVPLDSTAAELLLTLGVSFILFHGGLQLSTRILGRVAIGLGLLAVPGVVVTALVAGSVAALAFDVPWSMGLLIGAVLAPTDPAILIPLFDRIGLRQKIEQTAIAESALNDATGAVLALVFAGVVLGDGDVRWSARDRLPRGPRDLHRARDRLRDRALARRVRPSCRGMARVGSDRGRCGRRGRVLLDRLGRGERLSGCVPRRAHRREHGSAAARDAFEPRARHAGIRRDDHRDRRDPRLHHRSARTCRGATSGTTSGLRSSSSRRSSCSRAR